MRREREQKTEVGLGKWTRDGGQPVVTFPPPKSRGGALARFGELHVQTGTQLISQWHSKYISQINPYVIPRMVSGPDYDLDNRWRRTKDAAVVSSAEFSRLLARRCEGQVRMDWSCVPIVRSVHFKYTAEHTAGTVAPFRQKAVSGGDHVANEMIQAAKDLYHHLWHGYTGRGVSKMPIAGDTTRLPHAVGLNPMAKKLAFAQHFLAKNQAGTQQLRQLMGHRLYGARVVYGDCLFITLSPNEQHSAWVMRLSRFRRNDPCLTATHPDAEIIRRMAGRQAPKLERDQAEVDLPPYELRRVIAARDPMSVVDAYNLQLRRLAFILGLRMCPHCPACNESFGENRRPCQDKFGSNMKPLGGVLGGIPAFSLGNEHQGNGTPHGHLQAHVVCAYQYGTLQEIADRIRRKVMEPEAVQRYQAWLHKEDPPAPTLHKEFQEKIYTEWRSRFSDPRHDGMSTIPEYLSAPSPGTLWNDKRLGAAEAAREGLEWLHEYLADAQFIFSRCQHHVHEKTKSGFQPLRACLGSRTKKSVCKHHFPKEKLLSEKMQVVCRGVARKLGLRTSGRRNALGKIIGRRTCVWQSGTAPSLAVVFRGNTHTDPNYRLVVIPETHDTELCKSGSCLEKSADIKQMVKAAQRAQRNATGYYCGYGLGVKPC